VIAASVASGVSGVRAMASDVTSASAKTADIRWNQSLRG
jgi:hypothetical protein